MVVVKHEDGRLKVYKDRDISSEIFRIDYGMPIYQQMNKMYVPFAI